MKPKKSKWEGKKIIKKKKEKEIEKEESKKRELLRFSQEETPCVSFGTSESEGTNGKEMKNRKRHKKRKQKENTIFPFVFFMASPRDWESGTNNRWNKAK